MNSAFASVFALLLLVVGLGVHDVARASAAELPLLGFVPDAEIAPHTRVVPEPAQWCATLQDAPKCEFPALEPETDGDPAGPDAPSLFQPEFGCKASVTATGQLLQGAAVTYSTRFAASAVFARAPPRFVCAPEGPLRHAAR